MLNTTKSIENTCSIDLAGSIIMKNKFSNFIEDKIKLNLKKENLLYKNLIKEDLSNRDTLEHIRNKFLELLKEKF
jgi:hypothetical protein